MDIHIILLCYVLGGITFIPLILFTLFLFHYLKTLLFQETSVGGLTTNETARDPDDGGYGTWITLSEAYEPELLTGPNRISSSSSSETFSKHETAYSSLFKLVNGNAGTYGNPIPATGAKATGRNDVLNGKITVYAVVRQGNLYLYSDATQSDIRHVIVLSNYVITLWPPNCPNGELFLKRVCICLIKLNRSSALHDYHNTDPKNAIYLYVNNCSDKEDFYFALIRSASLHSKEFNARGLHNINPSLVAQALELNEKDVMELLGMLRNTESRYRWFNAVIGRLFLAIKGTEEFNTFIASKIERKLQRLKLPGFITGPRVQEIEFGGILPKFNEIEVKELLEDGTLILKSTLTYSGRFGVSLSANLKLNFGSKIRTCYLPLELSIRLLKLQGSLVLKIKPPPSSRIWYGFESMPVLDLQILPTINSRSVAIPVITSSIGRKLKEAIQDSIVLPHMDDIAFFDASSDFYKGGIWKRSNTEHPRDVDMKQQGEGGDIFQDSSDPSVSILEELLKSCSQIVSLDEDSLCDETSKCHNTGNGAVNEDGIFNNVTSSDNYDSETSSSSSNLRYRRSHGKYC